jgi:hypothetical protein
MFIRRRRSTSLSISAVGAVEIASDSDSFQRFRQALSFEFTPFEFFQVTPFRFQQLARRFVLDVFLVSVLEQGFDDRTELSVLL